MPIQILMPALSPTMTEGNLVKWHKAEGDSIKAGDLLAEIETDKATMEVEAVDEGVLGKIVIAEGTDNVPVNALIGLILEEGEDAEALNTVADPVTVASPAPLEVVAPNNLTSAPASLPDPSGERLFASPLARKVAAMKNIELSLIKGTGPRGRIIKDDVEAYTSSLMTKAVMTNAASLSDAYTDVPLTSMRKTIAKRLVEAKQTIPHFYLTVDCDIDALLDLRAKLNSLSEEQKLSVNDFIIRASALALKKVPEANATFHDTFVRRYEACDVAVAVAIEGGLVTPIVRHADAKSVKTISSEMKVLAQKARSGKLKPEDYQGGGFSLSNLGMYGVKNFGAIINPPQASILAVGAGEKRPVCRNGALEIATVMTCTLSVDHRAIDGAVGAEFLNAFKTYVEKPLSLLI